MKKLLKKISLFFLSFLVLISSYLTILAPSAHAQSTWYNQNPLEWYLKVYDPSISPTNEIFGERYTAAQVQWIQWSLISQVINIPLLGHTEVLVCILNGPLTCATDTFKSLFDGASKDITDFFSLSSNNTAGSFLAVVGSSPVSGIAYTKNLLNKLRIVSPVYAQGAGYNAARSVMELWKVTRNISYMFLVLIVIIMAFMIMFRVKLSPQVIISVQSALPKLIIAVILITFSYAIAGFLIDLMYVIIGLLALLISQSGMTTEGASNLFLEFTTKHNAISLLFEYWFMFVCVSLTTIVSSWNPTTWIGGLLLSIFAVVTILAIIWYSIKMIIVMFKNFVLIIFDIITAPLEIMLGTVAGFSGFGPWFKKFVSHLAVYPVWAIMFFLAFFFLGQAIPDWFPNFNQLNIFPFNIKLNFIAANAWDPPLSTWIVTGESLIWAIVSFFIITMTPKVTEVIQAAIQNKPFAYGTGVGEVANAGRFVGSTAENVSRSTAVMGGAGKTSTAIINALKWLAFLPK
jgi:hypothetical protein